MRQSSSLGKWITAAAVVLVAAAPASAQIVFDYNVLFDNPGANGDYENDAAGVGPCFTTETELGETDFTHNQSQDAGETADPKLIDPYNETAPNWRPQAGMSSAALNESPNYFPIGAVPNDGFFTQKCFRGALGPDSGDDWTAGWTYYSKDGAGRTDINYGLPINILAGTLATQTLLNTSNHLLVGRVVVPSGVTLTVNAGTVIFGEAASSGYLVVERGGNVELLGTAAAPIIFTSDQAPGTMARGDWGGILINGFARANCAACTSDVTTCIAEADSSRFCGQNDADDSGTLRYVRIEFAGDDFLPDIELNELTLNAVGSGTEVDYVQCHMGFDDAHEWFGGTVDGKHLLATGPFDDGLDWQLGYRGRVQCAIVQLYSDTGERGIEADNSQFGADLLPRSNPIFSNITLVGRGAKPGAGISNNGVYLRRGTAGTVINSVMMGWLAAAIDVDDNATFAGGCGPAPAVAFDCDARTDVPGSPLPVTESLVVRTAPNPAVESTSFSFNLPAAGHTTVDIFDASGRLVQNLADGNLTAGRHDLTWRIPASSAAGNFFYRVESNGAIATGKIVSVR